MEFTKWPKTPRLNREMVVTEKIDGTNAAVVVQETTDGDPHPSGSLVEVSIRDKTYAVAAQSRSRLLSIKEDNFGFAKWVSENAYHLADTLGPGTHFGEWWGQGIQRGYDMKAKYFSLFNVKRYGDIDLSSVQNLKTVPVIYTGQFDTAVANSLCEVLRMEGSEASPGFPNPEGIIVFHSSSNSVFKVTVEQDEFPKSASPSTNL